MICYRAPAVIAACIEEPFVAQLKAAAGQVKVVEGYACRRCHHVKSCGVANADVWNVVIAFLTGGLLYGSEVERPAWARKRRKKKFRPRVDVPAPRRAMVQELLLKGLTYKQIASELGITFGRAQRHANRVYAHNGVTGQGRIALAKVLGVELPPGTAVRRFGGGVRVKGVTENRRVPRSVTGRSVTGRGSRAVSSIPNAAPPTRILAGQTARSEQE